MSSANFTGLAVLENPRPEVEENSGKMIGKGVIFDAQFYLGPSSEPVLACLRYFNATDLAFDEFGTFFVYATVAKMVKGANTHTNAATLTNDDYHLVGDILWLIRAEVEDAKHRPYVQVSGTVKNIKQDDATFDIDAAQYTTSLKDRRADSNFPLHVFIPDSARYKSKPVPKPNSNVLVTGFLEGLIMGQSGAPDRFRIDMDNITFLGRSTLPMSPGAVQTPETGKKRKLKYSFDSPSPLPSKRAKQSNAENIPLLSLSRS